MKLLVDNFDLAEVLERTRETGYFFEDDAVELEALLAIEKEVSKLQMEVGDHVKYAINKGATNEVRQMHERAYRPLGHEEVPIGTEICRSLAKSAEPFILTYPELNNWMPTEIGYQRYRDGRDWISPHRDRKSDHLLSVTFTVNGSAEMRIYESEVEPPDYSQLRLIDKFLTKPGTAMFLRAPGFGSGKQIIHEVMPPISGSRLILNLRMRESILKPPGETRWNSYNM